MASWLGPASPLTGHVMTDSPAPAGAEKGLFGRAIGVIFSPGETFRHVVRNPRAVGVLFLASVVIALATGLPQFTERGGTLYVFSLP